jgi:hypothetical protein
MAKFRRQQFLSRSSSPAAGRQPPPSILLNPPSLSFSGIAGGADPLAQTINLVNSAGGTLTWSMMESAAWLALNITSGTTTTESDQVSASVSVQGMVAGAYNTVITVGASGAANSPQQIPVSLTLSQPTTGSASLSWAANAESDLVGYKVYIGTQSGRYDSPITLGAITAYTATNLALGRTYYFCISAFNSASNESLCSAEVSKPRSGEQLPVGASPSTSSLRSSGRASLKSKLDKPSPVSSGRTVLLQATDAQRAEGSDCKLLSHDVEPALIYASWIPESWPSPTPPLGDGGLASLVRTTNAWSRLSCASCYSWGTPPLRPPRLPGSCGGPTRLLPSPLFPVLSLTLPPSSGLYRYPPCQAAHPPSKISFNNSPGDNKVLNNLEGPTPLLEGPLHSRYWIWGHKSIDVLYYLRMG